MLRIKKWKCVTSRLGPGIILTELQIHIKLATTFSSRRSTVCAPATWICSTILLSSTPSLSSRAASLTLLASSSVGSWVAFSSATWTNRMTIMSSSTFSGFSSAPWESSLLNSSSSSWTRFMLTELMSYSWECREYESIHIVRIGITTDLRLSMQM